MNIYILKVKQFIKEPHFPYLLDVFFKKRLRPIFPYLYRMIRYGRTNINTSKYWDEIWEEEGSHTWRKYDKIYSKITEITPPTSKIIDVGCGVGILMHKLKNQTGSQVYGIDISRVAIEKLYQQHLYGQVSQLPFLGLKNDLFDVAIATELLEHLTNPETGIKEISRVVKPDGLMIFTVPDNCMGTRETDDHLHQYTQNSFKELIKNFGEIKLLEAISDIGGAHLVAVLQNSKN